MLILVRFLEVFFEHFGSILNIFGGLWGVIWRPFGGFGESFGVLWEPFGGACGMLWARVARGGSQGAVWEVFGSLLEPFGRYFGVLWEPSPPIWEVFWSYLGDTWEPYATRAANSSFKLGH